jgi:uncharacterized DUF497 family protein
MKPFAWNEEKNVTLREERGIGFEDILIAIDEGQILAALDHPNQKRYPNQQILAIAFDGYAYLVPFVEGDDEIFFKTIIPSRQATKQYLVNK